MSENTQQTDWKNRDIGALWQRQGRNQKYLSGHVKVKDGEGNLVEHRVIIFSNKMKSADNQPDFRVYSADDPAPQKGGDLLSESDSEEVLVCNSESDAVSEEVL